MGAGDAPWGKGNAMKMIRRMNQDLNIAFSANIVTSHRTTRQSMELMFSPGNSSLRGGMYFV